MKGRTCSRGHEFYGSEPCPICWPGYRTFEMRVKVWLYTGDAAWHFVTVPKKQSDEIRERFATAKRGWGSLPVHVTIGNTSWDTSIFPDKKTASYLLPIKSDVRKRENIQTDDTVMLKLEVQA